MPPAGAARAPTGAAAPPTAPVVAPAPQAFPASRAPAPAGIGAGEAVERHVAPSGAPAADGAAVPLARPQAEPAPGLRAKSRASGVDEGERSEKAAAPTQASREQAFRTPEDWINEIRALRRAGRDSEWRASLARFRERYPDYGIPSDLRN